MEKVRQYLRENPSVEQLYLEYSQIDDLKPLMPYLAQLPQLRQLYIYGNNLSSLPVDMSSLHLDTLDASNNPVLDVKESIAGLQSLKELKHLFIPCALAEDQEAILQALPRLTTLNGSAVNVDSVASAEVSSTATGNASSDRRSGRREEEEEEYGDDEDAPAEPDVLTLTDEDVNDVAVLYDKIRKLRRDDQAEEARRISQFDDHVQQITERLSNRLRLSDDPYVAQAEVWAAKHALYDICVTSAIEFAAASSEGFADVLRHLRKANAHCVGGLANVPTLMSPYYTRKLRRMQEEVNHAEHETAELLEAAELLEKETQGYVDEKRAMTEDFEHKKAELLETMGWLKTENEKLQARVRVLENSRSKNVSAMSPAGFRTKSPIRHVVSSPRVISTTTTAAADAPPQQGSSSKPTKPSMSSNGQQGATTSVRDLSLAKLKEVIEEIYQSKTKFDQKCTDAHLPKETLEQHLYTFLNQKYGLKTLIIEWATAIINGVKKFQSEDNDVAVFGKILRNEIDEDFRAVQKQLKETVCELLRVYLKGKFPLKRDDDISALLKKRMNGYVYEEEWVDIIKYMYNHDDSVQLIVKVKEAIRLRQQESQQQQQSGVGGGGKSAARRVQPEPDPKELTKVSYTDFLKVLLDFQLRGHEKFLQKFMRLFRQFDSDKNGILDEEEFKQLILSIDPVKTDREVAMLLDEADPHGNRQINFTECVRFLASDIVPLNKSVSATATD